MFSEQIHETERISAISKPESKSLEAESQPTDDAVLAASGKILTRSCSVQINIKTKA